ncbi:MAG TPA: chorismate synthase [Euzebyales bacterium]|nr:chorismate synthase [Euzebyales bacterium]
MSLRYLTAGESHGPALVGILEGMPAGVPVDRKRIAQQLARRRTGHGRSPRMSFETDTFEILGGVRHGLTLGSPVALVIRNTEWPKWRDAMAVDAPDDPDAVAATGRGTPLTRPRPGHADLVGMQKYHFDDARNVLERASARETAMRVGLAAVTRGLLDALGIDIVSHVVRIGGAAVDADLAPAEPRDQQRIDADPVRCADADASKRMQAAIDEAKAQRDTLGGVIEVLVYGVPPGLGSHVHWDRKLDTRLAAALMSVQAMKAVEIGDGLRLGRVPGSQAHDEIAPSAGDDVVTSGGAGGWSGRAVRRLTDRAGGIEGGMSTGAVLRMRATMKPISSLTQPLRTVDTTTGEAAVAITQRSDVCAVPRAGVVAEAVVAHEVARALLEKTGGDSLGEVRDNLERYLARLPVTSVP